MGSLIRGELREKEITRKEVNGKLTYSGRLSDKLAIVTSKGFLMLQTIVGEVSSNTWNQSP